MFDVFPFPGFRVGLAGQGHGPESPDFLAGGLIERRDEAADSFVAARRARNNQIADRERRGRPVIVLMPIRHFGFPQQLAIGAAQRDHVGVVGEHEHAIAGDCYTAIESTRGVSGDTARPVALVMPDDAAGACIERPAFVRLRRVHHAIDYQRRVFDGGRAGHRENPAGRQPGDVGLIDLREFAVAVAAGIAVVRRPIGLRRDHAIAVAVGFAQQTNLLVVGTKLQVGHAFGKDLSLERLPIGGLDGPAVGCLGKCRDKDDENA